MIAGFDVPIRRAVAAGIVATAAMEVFLVELAPRLGWGQVNYPRLLGTLLLANFEGPESVRCLLAGGLLFLAGGIGWSLIYAYSVYSHLVGPAWFQGLTYAGIGVFLFSTLVFFPLLSWIHPWVRAGLVAVPSLFGPGLPEGRLVVGNLLGHGLFGFIVGIVCRRQLVFS
jgi:hypothetical protein